MFHKATFGAFWPSAALLSQAALTFFRQVDLALFCPSATLVYDHMGRLGPNAALAAFSRRVRSCSAPVLRWPKAHLGRLGSNAGHQTGVELFCPSAALANISAR